jgi:hypothetical protein
MFWVYKEARLLRALSMTEPTLSRSFHPRPRSVAVSNRDLPHPQSRPCETSRLRHEPVKGLVKCPGLAMHRSWNDPNCCLASECDFGERHRRRLTSSKVNNKMEKLQSKTFHGKLKNTDMLMPDAPPTASTTDDRNRPRLSHSLSLRRKPLFQLLGSASSAMSHVAFAKPPVRPIAKPDRWNEWVLCSIDWTLQPKPCRHPATNPGTVRHQMGTHSAAHRPDVTSSLVNNVFSGRQAGRLSRFAPQTVLRQTLHLTRPSTILTIGARSAKQDDPLFDMPTMQQPRSKL